MDLWGPKHCRADNSLWINSIIRTLCIWLDYIYTTWWYTVHTISNIINISVYQRALYTKSYIRSIVGCDIILYRKGIVAQHSVFLGTSSPTTNAAKKKSLCFHCKIGRASSSYPSVFWSVGSCPSGFVAGHSLHCRISPCNLYVVQHDTQYFFMIDFIHKIC
jgi:hypothetical protein